ncbi:MAG: NAD(P)-dependent oxidoreductase, partial [Akkermansiaceae bacterium]|nr:NAD(P)-dependent oxidoreductase [Akkermansiaceae bacterium]
EQAVLAHPNTCVMRISWVFGPEKPSFVDGILHSALQHEPLAAVADKFSLPTFTRDLTDWVLALARSEATGIFHACNSGEPASWHDLAEAVVDHLVRSGRLEARPPVARQLLDEVPRFRATRPRHTALATGRLTALLGNPPRPWRDALADYLDTPPAPSN